MKTLYMRNYRCEKFEFKFKIYKVRSPSRCIRNAKRFSSSVLLRPLVSLSPNLAYITWSIEEKVDNIGAIKGTLKSARGKRKTRRRPRGGVFVTTRYAEEKGKRHDTSSRRLSRISPIVKSIAVLNNNK